MEARLPNGNIVKGNIAGILVVKGVAVDLTTKASGNIAEVKESDNTAEPKMPEIVKEKQSPVRQKKQAGRPKGTVKK